MGNGCKYNHHFQYQHGLNHVQKSTFLPMLCSRTSIKDVALQQPRPLQGSSASNSSSSSSSNDPLSPKIGCMGQVKRHNKITGFPTSTSHFGTNKLALTTTSNNDVSYFKLKRFFSAKNLNNNSNAICTGSFCRRRRRTRRVMNSNNNTLGVTASVSSRQRGRNENQGTEVCLVNIAEMDPPLPVIKRVRKPTDCEEDVIKNSLWKRRSNGGALKILELQQIQIPRYQVELQTV